MKLLENYLNYLNEFGSFGGFKGFFQRIYTGFIKKGYSPEKARELTQKVMKRLDADRFRK